MLNKNVKNYILHLILDYIQKLYNMGARQMVVTNKSQKFGRLPFGRVNKVTQQIW